MLLRSRPPSWLGVDYRWTRLVERDYPALYAHVMNRVDEGWEPTMAVLEEGVGKGEFRRVNGAILKELLLAAMRSVISDSFAAAQGMRYEDAFCGVFDILFEGIKAPGKAGDAREEGL